MDITSGFKAFKLSALKKLPWDNINAKGFAFQSEMAYQCQKSQLNIIEIPIEFNSRYNGYSKMSKLIILETIYRVLRIRIKSSFVK
jgi:dolichol-phosphate mannosyltransferase